MAKRPNTQPFRPEEGRPIVAGQFKLGDRVRHCENGSVGTVQDIYTVVRGTLVRVQWDGEQWEDKTLPPSFTTVPLADLCPEDES